MDYESVYEYETEPEIAGESYDSDADDALTVETPEEPRALSRKERRERDAAAERERNSRAAKKARREAEYAAPPSGFAPNFGDEGEMPF